MALSAASPQSATSISADDFGTCKTSVDPKKAFGLIFAMFALRMPVIIAKYSKWLHHFPRIL
jgi:hypothetical protein